MPKRHIEPMHDNHVNVTPLIDVIMCLIIFFMLVGKLVKDDVVDLVIPKAGNGQEMEDQQGRLTINIVPVLTNPQTGEAYPVDHRPPPNVVIHGQIINTNDGWKELTAELRKEKSENPDLKVILRADKNEKYDWIAPALVACARADIRNVNFSTKSGG